MGPVVNLIITILSIAPLRKVVAGFAADVMIALIAKSKSDPKLKAELDEVLSLNAQAQTTEDRREVARRLYEIQR